MVKSDEIAAILVASENLEDAVEALVARANEAGGRDNITVVAFRVADAGEVAADSGATLIGPSAEEAGLTGERIRAAAERHRGDRPAPRPRRRWRTVGKVLIALLIIAALGVGAVLGARQIYFLGVDDAGQVALYRGLPYVLPFDLNLYSEVDSAPVRADALPPDRTDEATDHQLRSHDDAVSLLDDLSSAAATPLPQPPAGGTGSAAGGGPSRGTAPGGGSPQGSGTQGGSGSSSGGGKGSGQDAGSGG
jgi:protein phosphatase